MKKRVIVGMSGGIDSTAVCEMLKEQGYEIVGITMWVWGDEPLDAKELAAEMGIEHYIVDEREAFKNEVVEYFMGEYCNGRTPNPCVMCNPTFKFRILREWAEKLNCDYIATGHYTKLEEINGNTYIVAGEDETKDQSYFLWKLPQDFLRKCIFPLGTYKKTDVRLYLKEKGYHVKASGSESMEVCFIKGDYRDFLKEHLDNFNDKIKEGKFVNSKGVVIGQHQGVPYYTIGQRKGLGIALGEPAYVLKLNAEKNTVMLGSADELSTRYMLVEQPEIVDINEFESADNLEVRIRYRSKPIPCKVKRLEDGRYLVHFAYDATAITPGQSAVFYIGKRVVGGAFIDSQKGIGLYISKEEI